MHKILIIEDQNHHFEKYRDLIYSEFGTNELEILPNLSGGAAAKTKSLESMSFIERRLNSGNDFSWIMREDIAIYIIDNCLIDDDTDTGVAIINYLNKKNEDLNLVLISDHVTVSPKFDAIRHFSKVINKRNYEDEQRLLDYIAMVTGLPRNNSKKTDHSKSTGVADTRADNGPANSHTGNGPGDNWFERICKGIKSAKWWRNSIGAGISFSFRVLIVFALIYGIINTYKKITQVSFLLPLTESKAAAQKPETNAMTAQASAAAPSQAQTEGTLHKDTAASKASVAAKQAIAAAEVKTNENNGEEGDINSQVAHDDSKKNSLALLDLAETVFLSFLPFFIIFSFLGYYDTYLSYIWESNKIAKADQGKSTATLRFSKALFISSIVATLIINIFEKLFSGNEKCGVTELIPHGILLVILMIYYLLLERENHQPPANP